MGNRIVMKFCIGVVVSDIITRANFGDDRFQEFLGSGGRIPSSLKHSGTTVPRSDSRKQT